MSDQPQWNNQTWVEDYSQAYCLDHPNNDQCWEYVTAFYQYRVNLAANAVFLGIFAACFLGYAVIWAITRRGAVFNIALMLGIMCEILGYVGRVWSATNEYEMDPFLIQICLLTIGPAFMAAGVYLCLRRIVSAFGAENSRIPPPYYTRIFIPCDVVSLILQAAGGAMASLAQQNGDSTDTGTYIMVAGLAFQVATMLTFIVVASDFGIRTWRRQRSLGSDVALSQDPVVVAVRNTLKFKLFLYALGLAAILILWRSAFRVAELSEGWTGEIMGDEDLFIAFEGVLIVVAVVVLLVFHPAICMGPLIQSGKSKQKADEKKGKAASDTESQRPGTDTPK